MINNNKKNIQLSLNLKKKRIYEEDDFLVSNSNKEAYKLINSWPEWKSRKIIIFGDSGTGKTHLSKIWKKKTSAINLNLIELKKIKFESFFQKKISLLLKIFQVFLIRLIKKRKIT